MINQLAALVYIHSQSVIYYWTVPIYKISDKGTSVLLCPEIYLKLLTIMSKICHCSLL